ncbi:type VI secretion system protein ImpH [Herbaspirillum sp. SJZ107]|nr:type VI secretion system protein ImpH [Herbaspirillum sp. SJZ107]
MPVIERLLAEPQRFEFFQAVRLLLLWLEERGVPPQQALDGHLRFANSLSLRFPASQVEALALVHDKPAHPAIARPQFRLTPSFMGLLGAHGTLPAHYTERIQAWIASEQDEAPRAFLDLLSNRMLALFYGAWKKYRVEHMVAGPSDRFLPLLLALAGFPSGALAGALPGSLAGAAAGPTSGGAAAAGAPAGIGNEVLALYAGVLRQRPASAAVLGQVLSDLLRVPVALQEWIGHWDRLDISECTALGGANAVLGQAALLGARCWRPDLRVRVRIGPVDSAQFERFLPHGSGAATLASLLGLFAAPTLSYEVVLVLRRTELRALRLGERSRRLGLDSYVVTAPATADRDDMRYTLRPLAALEPVRPSTP